MICKTHNAPIVDGFGLLHSSDMQIYMQRRHQYTDINLSRNYILTSQQRLLRWRRSWHLDAQGPRPSSATTSSGRSRKKNTAELSETHQKALDARALPRKERGASYRHGHGHAQAQWSRQDLRRYFPAVTFYFVPVFSCPTAQTIKCRRILKKKTPLEITNNTFSFIKLFIPCELNSASAAPTIRPA